MASEDPGKLQWLSAADIHRRVPCGGPISGVNRLCASKDLFYVVFGTTSGGQSLRNVLKAVSFGASTKVYPVEERTYFVFNTLVEYATAFSLWGEKPSTWAKVITPGQYYAVVEIKHERCVHRVVAVKKALNVAFSQQDVVAKLIRMINEGSDAWPQRDQSGRREQPPPLQPPSEQQQEATAHQARAVQHQACPLPQRPPPQQPHQQHQNPNDRAADIVEGAQGALCGMEHTFKFIGDERDEIGQQLVQLGMWPLTAGVAHAAGMATAALVGINIGKLVVNAIDSHLKNCWHAQVLADQVIIITGVLEVLRGKIEEHRTLLEERAMSSSVEPVVFAINTTGTALRAAKLLVDDWYKQRGTWYGRLAVLFTSSQLNERFTRVCDTLQIAFNTLGHTVQMVWPGQVDVQGSSEEMAKAMGRLDRGIEQLVQELRSQPEAMGREVQALLAQQQAKDRAFMQSLLSGMSPQLRQAFHDEVSQLEHVMKTQYEALLAGQEKIAADVQGLYEHVEKLQAFGRRRLGWRGTRQDFWNMSYAELRSAADVDKNDKITAHELSEFFRGYDLDVDISLAQDLLKQFDLKSEADVERMKRVLVCSSAAVSESPMMIHTADSFELFVSKAECGLVMVDSIELDEKHVGKVLSSVDESEKITFPLMVKLAITAQRLAHVARRG